MTTFLFPGQGSQKIGMGEGLFEEFPHITRIADEILGYSIQKLCLEDPASQLSETQFTQPALYTVNALMLEKHRQTGTSPTFVAGHSLGEFNALLAANVFDFKTGLLLVKKRGELMSRAQGGAMAAIIGLTVEQIQTYLQAHPKVEIANYNSPLQTVITGEKTAVEASLDGFKSLGAKLVVPLKVSGAFHSSLMKEAQAQFSEFISQFSFNAPQIPVIANITATPYPNTGISNLLTTQIASSVRWTQTIHYLLDQGETEFEEVGPGKVLAGLVNAVIKSRN